MKKLLKITLFILVSFLSIYSNADERLKMTFEHGVYTMPCEVNGLRMKFVFDTGAASVCISVTEAIFMLKNGYIDYKDFEDGYALTQIANGEIEENMVLNLKEVKVGSKKIKNVKAVISNSIDAPLLLGQSVIRKLGVWTIEGDYLVLKNSKGDNNSKEDNKVISNNENLPKKQNDSSEDYYKKGLSYMDAKDVDNAFKYFKKAAEMEHSDAQVAVGILYEDGVGISKDMNQAFKWYKKAAENGNYFGQYYLALCYESGKATEVNSSEAFKWFSKSAEQGYAEAQRKSGYYCFNGIGISEDLPKALYWYKKIAEQGDLFAQTIVAKCYYFGIGTKKNFNEAASWFIKAANQGDSEAQNYIANCYFYGEGVKKDLNQAFGWYFKSAVQDNVYAQYNLGNCYYKGLGTSQYYKKAYSCYYNATDKGKIPEAEFMLGECYNYGYGTEKSESSAVLWYRYAAQQNDDNAKEMLKILNKSIEFESSPGFKETMSNLNEYSFNSSIDNAKNGNTIAQNNIGDYYLEKQDYSCAVYWYKKAASKGYAEAQNNLGLCYYHGKGVQLDYKEAFTWFNKSAKNNNCDAQNNLGICYLYGKGVTKNNKQAIYWFEKASENLNIISNFNLGYCYENGSGTNANQIKAIEYYKKLIDFEKTFSAFGIQKEAITASKAALSRLLNHSGKSNYSVSNLFMTHDQHSRNNSEARRWVMVPYLSDKAKAEKSYILNFFKTEPDKQAEPNKTINNYNDYKPSSSHQEPNSR